MHNSKSVSWKQTRAYLREDRKRLKKYFETHFDFPPPRFHIFIPSYQAVFLHRVSAYFYQRGNPWIARLFWHLNLLLTGADISPISRVGPGLLFLHPQGSTFIGVGGKNLTMYGQCGFGGGIANKDIGAGPGLPILGDDVAIGFGAVILGPIRIGDRSRIGPRCLITNDTPPDSFITAADPIIRQSSMSRGDEKK